ncbi:MAG TPA: rRNA maturation RNase YbeY [Terracidiphilus sp.]
MDPDPTPHTSVTKRAPSTVSTPADRASRLPSARTLSRFLGEAQASVRLQGQVSVLLTTDRNIRRLNRQFRGQDKATDVLSFPAAEAAAQEVAGDLAISVPTALRQAREQGHTLGVEIKVLILHGLLHLAGFDHERDTGQMARRERLLRGRLGLPQGLIERAAERPTPLRAPSPRLGSVARVGGHQSIPARKDSRTSPARRSPRA